MVEVNRVRSWLSRRSSNFVPLLCIVGAVVVANLLPVLHLVTTNPLVLDAHLTVISPGWLPGLPFIDPNAGFTMQSLGHLAALDWLHGHVPWWNPYEGVGSPLAGEMQSGAFFPLTIVMALNQGALLMQLILEMATGWSTYFLVRRLGVGRSFSTMAGVAFGLCGTYAWLAHAPIRPVALLPLCLLGVELAVESAGERRRGGWYLLAVALALSIFAGFPETTFLDGLLIAWWSVLRILGPGRTCWRPLVGKLAMGALVGIGLAAPVIVAFTDYLPYANVGGHNGSFSHGALPPAGLVQTILPYSLGPIFGYQASNGSNTLPLLWGNVGGFLTATLIAAALVGLIGRRHRLLRLGLGGWILVCLLRTFGFPVVVDVMAHLPGVRLTAFFRYADPSWELAAVVLAALGLDDIARNFTRRRTLIVSALVTGVGALWAVMKAWSILTDAVGSSVSQTANRHLYDVGSLALACTTLALLAIGGLRASRPSRSLGVERVRRHARNERVRKRGRALMAATVCVESVVLLGFADLSAPKPSALALGSVNWLQAHLGTSRFMTLGPIQPNYGSYFGVAEVNINDLPFPQAWSNYVERKLDTNAIPGSFTGVDRRNPARPTPAQELTANIRHYEEIGVGYVVEASTGLDIQGQPFPTSGSPPWPAGPRLVYRDSFAEIWQLPSVMPVFTLRHEGQATGTRTATGCSVTGVGWDEATVTCPSRSTLVRRVQFVSGWTATFNGTSRPVREDRSGPAGLFQAVSVPPGTTTLRFTYLPPHENAAVVAATLALVILVASYLTQQLHRRRTSQETGSDQDEVPEF